MTFAAVRKRSVDVIDDFPATQTSDKSLERGKPFSHQLIAPVSIDNSSSVLLTMAQRLFDTLILKSFAADTTAVCFLSN